MMTEYVVMHVLRFHREMPAYQAAQANREWLRTPIVRPEQRRVGFLGFGLMAKAPALVLKSLGFRSRPGSARRGRARRSRSSTAAISSSRFSSQTDIAVCLLPLTRGDRGHLLRAHVRHDAERRDADEYRARQACGRQRSDRRARFGQLSYAALDALWPEPLPPESPLWPHPKVTVMPHVARRPTVAQLVTEIVANIRSLRAGGRLLQEVDITQGY